MVASALIWLWACVLYNAQETHAIVAPNHFIGKCLTDDWVASMERSLGVKSKERDGQNRLVNPFLHAAVKHPLNVIDDARTASTDAFKSTCIPSGASIYGLDAVVDATSGAVLNPGRTNGTLVVELSGWITHSLTTVVFSIIAQEIYGVPVSLYYDTSTVEMKERMSSAGAGTCTPTHLNLEVWLSTSKPSLFLHANESYVAGDAAPGYKFYEDLITAVPVSALRNNPAFFPPSDPGCADNIMGCTNACSKSAACVTREAQGKECMVVAMMYDYFDPGYMQAVLSNIGMATYFCFIGYNGVQDFALDAYANKRPVLFYHYEPDPFHIDHPGIFERVFLPRSIPERVVLATGLYSNGGNSTENPVDVDFPNIKLSKYASYVVENADPIHSLISKFSISELHSNDLLRRYRSSSANANDVDPTFTAACSWIRDNYAEWTKWLDRKPLCVMYDTATSCFRLEHARIQLQQRAALHI